MSRAWDRKRRTRRAWDRKTLTRREWDSKRLTSRGWKSFLQIKEVIPMRYYHLTLRIVLIESKQ